MIQTHNSNLKHEIKLHNYTTLAWLFLFFWPLLSDVVNAGQHKSLSVLKFFSVFSQKSKIHNLPEYHTTTKPIENPLDQIMTFVLEAMAFPLHHLVTSLISTVSQYVPAQQSKMQRQ